MRIFPVCGYLALLSVLAHPAFSGIRPSFGLDYSSWRATHIVVVITTRTDGTFEVVESWKGDLSVGEQLVIPELRPALKAIPISRYPKSWSEVESSGVSEMLPRQPVGSRMVLFLENSAGELARTNGTGKFKRQGWKPADIMGEMKASVLWIDGAQLYRFTQLVNPGPSVLFEFPGSEEKVRNRVAEIERVQEEIAEALAASDGGHRANGLKTYVHSDILPARSLALQELGKSGPAALPTIRGLLDDPAFADEASGLVKALVTAGGEAVSEELNNRLRRDLAFWRSTGPTLPRGWWNLDPSPTAPLRERYEQTYELIVGLEHTHYTAALNTSVNLRDFWRSLPQLNDPSGLNQLADECDKLISHLQAN